MNATRTSALALESSVQKFRFFFRLNLSFEVRNKPRTLNPRPLNPKPLNPL